MSERIVFTDEELTTIIWVAQNKYVLIKNDVALSRRAPTQDESDRMQMLKSIIEKALSEKIGIHARMIGLDEETYRKDFLEKNSDKIKKFFYGIEL